MVQGSSPRAHAHAHAHARFPIHILVILSEVEGSLTISLLDIGRSAVGVYYSLFLYFSCRRVRRSLLRGSLPKTLPSASHFRYHSCRDRRTNSTPARPRAAACTCLPPGALSIASQTIHRSHPVIAPGSSFPVRRLHDSVFHRRQPEEQADYTDFICL